jgi:hypothetical protein
MCESSSFSNLSSDMPPEPFDYVFGHCRNAEMMHKRIPRSSLHRFKFLRRQTCMKIGNNVWQRTEITKINTK